MSAEDVRKEYMESLGPDLGQVFYALRNEVLWLHLRWSEYLVLFGGGRERLKLINSAAGHFFRVVQNDLVRATLLHLCRLTDPPVTGKYENLTLRRLPKHITDTAVVKTTQPLVDDAVEKTAFARDLRDQHIAHTDLNVALDEGATPSPIHRNDIDNALAAVGAVLDHVSRQLLDREMLFEVIAPPGAEALLYVIRDGLEADKQRLARMKEGRMTDEDQRGPQPLP